MQKKNVSTLKNNVYFLKLIWDICPSRVILNFVATFLSFAEWTFYSVFFMRYLFGTVEGTRSFEEVVWFIWIVVVLNIGLNSFMAWYGNCFVPKTNVTIHYHLNSKLFQKAQGVDLSCYETPDFYNTYTRAMTEAGERAFGVLDSWALFVSSFISSMVVIITMSEITLWSLVFIFVPLMAHFILGKKEGKIQYDMQQESVPANRRMDYVNRVVYFRKYAGELRLTNVYQVLKSMFKSAADETVEVANTYAKKRLWIGFSKNWLVFVLGFEGMWICAAILAVLGYVSVSQLIVLLNAIVSVSWMIKDFAGSITSIQTNAFFIENLKTFLDYVPRIDERKGGLEPPESVHTIEFQNVSFRYPGQETDALQKINYTFQRGVRHALVGINGSGKSTLIKLLLRFYDPTEGVILLNGVDIREYDIKKYRQSVGAAFQDFALFSASVLENILLKEVTSEEERKNAIQALKDSGAWEKISSLPEQENTPLTKEFDNSGVELSGGERQKLAIARAFAKRNAVVILDEPSSALDPIAEYQMFETITDLCKEEEKLSIIVSHRLSSAAICEQILVLENGILKETGTHEALLKANGTYAYMFRKQAENYQVKVGDFDE